MTTKAGVWIDHHKAVVVVISDQGEVTREIHSHLDTEREFANERTGDTGQHHSFRRPENMEEHRFMNQLNTFYDEVLTCLRGADSVLILGPGEAKGEFEKRLVSKRFPAQVVELEVADKMTDRQIAASVRQHHALAERLP